MRPAGSLWYGISKVGIAPDCSKELDGGGLDKSKLESFEVEDDVGGGGSDVFIFIKYGGVFAFDDG
jgi:hypothetical protein